MKIAEAMTKEPLSALADGSIREAAAGMRDAGIGSLPVVDREKQLVGMVTDRDIAVRAAGEGRGPETLVRDVMTEALVVVDESLDLKDALSLMSAHQIRRLPVISAGCLVGIVSLADVVAVAKPRQLAETLRIVSEPASSQAEKRTNRRTWARFRLA